MPSMPPITVMVKEYCPDQPEFASGTSVSVVNVVPRTASSYGPLPDYAPYATSALPARPQGAYGGADPDGNVSVFVGTVNNLYQMQTGSTAFSNVSKSVNAYTCPSDESWSFALFNARILAANIDDPIQTFVLGTDTKFSDLAAAAPKARYVTTAKNFLIAANTSDPIGGLAPWRVWWSALGDPTSWPTPGTSAAAAVQSDYNDTVGEGGAITGIVGNLGTADAAIFYERAVWRMIYVGPPAIFNFVPAEGVRGTIAPGSIAQLGSVVFYLGEDGFYMFDGTQSIPIGANKVDRTFLANLAANGQSRITSAIDPVRKLYIVSYPSFNAGRSLTPDTLLIYNWTTQRWTTAHMTLDMIFRAFTFGYTLDGLDATGYNIDTLPFSLDSRVWTAGSLLLGAFQNDILGYLSGSNLAVTVDTDEIQPFPGQRTFVSNSRPLVDTNTMAGIGDAAILVTLVTRDSLEDLPIGTAVGAINSLGWAPLRGSGRYVRARILIPANVGFDHLQGTELQCRPIGVR